MNNLPKVTAFEIKEKLNNSQERFYGNSHKLSYDAPKNIDAKINSIFASNDHVYKSRVRISLKDDILDRVLIGKTKDELLTITGDKIRISDIMDITKI